MPSTRMLVLFATALALWSAANVAWTMSLARTAPAEHAPEAHAEHPAAPAEPLPALPPARTLALPAEARDAILAEMRVMLGSVQGALEAAARGDTAALRAAVHPSGMAMAADPALEAMLPADWMALAVGVHRAFDSLPGAGADPATVSAGMARLLSGCNGCHAAYRLEVR